MSLADLAKLSQRLHRAAANPPTAALLSEVVSQAVRRTEADMTRIGRGVRFSVSPTHHGYRIRLVGGRRGSNRPVETLRNRLILELRNNRRRIAHMASDRLR